MKTPRNFFLYRPSLWARCWLIVVAALLLHNLYLFAVKSVRFDTNILALLPSEKKDDTLDHAMNRLIHDAEQKIIIAIGAQQWETASNATDAFIRVLALHPDLVEVTDTHDDTSINAIETYFQDRRFNLLTPRQVDLLRHESVDYWVEEGERLLYAPLGDGVFSDRDKDPFGLFNDWIKERFQSTKLRPRDGKLSVFHDDRHYAVLWMTLKPSAFSIDTQKKWGDIFDAARLAANLVGENQHDAVTLLKSGMIFHATHAASRAQQEIFVIGLGSLIGVLILIYSLFRSIRPLILIALSLGVGFLGALSISHLIFGNIHLLTLVFGASLIGIAQDYGIYYLYQRAQSTSFSQDATLHSVTPPITPPAPPLIQRLLPALAFALATTSVGYLGIAFLPFDGLRQMAVFSISGLAFAWLTVVCFFPWLAKDNPLRAAHWQHYRKLIDFYPRLKSPTLMGAIFLVSAVLMVWGLSRLAADDNIRALQSPDPALIQDQMAIDAIIESPRGMQFYWVRGDSQDEVLEREENLKLALSPLLAQQSVTHVQSVSDWVPSYQAQQNHRALIAQHLFNQGGALDTLARQIHAKPSWTAQLNLELNRMPLITMDEFLKSREGSLYRPLWFDHAPKGFFSIVMLSGFSINDLPELDRIGQSLPGVMWVDRIAMLSGLLGEYRRTMEVGVILAYISIFCILYFRYRKNTWRIVAAPALASLMALALLGFTQTPIQFFNVVSLMLILGMGVDYGIFLQEHGHTNPQAAWVEIGASAMTTLLSFGLLTLSQTPILHSFGLTLVFGMILLWLIAPLFHLPSNRRKARVQ
ncbi:MAG: transporter [Burkholderiales bacterium]|jgi:predicted exporter|nr:transporter [Burkholderiales bacterium]